MFSCTVCWVRIFDPKRVTQTELNLINSWYGYNASVSSNQCHYEINFIPIVPVTWTFLCTWSNLYHNIIISNFVNIYISFTECSHREEQHTALSCIIIMSRVRRHTVMGYFLKISQDGFSACSISWFIAWMSDRCLMACIIYIYVWPFISKAIFIFQNESAHVSSNMLQGTNM